MVQAEAVANDAEARLSRLAAANEELSQHLAESAWEVARVRALEGKDVLAELAGSAWREDPRGCLIIVWFNHGTCLSMQAQDSGDRDKLSAIHAALVTEHLVLKRAAAQAGDAAAQVGRQ